MFGGSGIGGIEVIGGPFVCCFPVCLFKPQTHGIVSSCVFAGVIRRTGRGSTRYA